MKIWKIIIVLLLVFLLVSNTFMMEGADAEKKKKAKKTRGAATGDTYDMVATRVLGKMLQDGMKVWDRSNKTIGILRAEVNLANAHGSDNAKDQAKQTLAYLEEDFFADVWVDFETNEKTGWTTVTIKVGGVVTVYMFVTPGPMDTAAQEFHANNIMDIMRGMLK